MRIAISPARTRPNPRKKRAGIYASAGLALAAALSIAGGLYLKRASLPVVLAVDPAIGDPGGTIRVVGRNFGDERGDSRVEFDDAAPTAASYLSWSDDLIELRVPHYAESSLVRVHTERGRSNARMFMSKALLPYRAEGSVASAVAPVIESLSADSGPVGSTLVIRGLNFGANKDDSELLFAWNGSTAFGSAQEPSGGGYVVPDASSGEYLSWSDKEIKVCVPDGAVSGSLAVRTARGTSEARYFQVSAGPGTKSYTVSRTYSISAFVTISRVRSGGANSLFLWMPFPSQSASQHGVKSLGRAMEPLVPDYKGLSVYRLSDLQSDKLVTVSHDFLVQVYGVDTEIKAERVSVPEGEKHPAFAYATRADALVPSDDEAVKALARKTVGKERNPYRNARSLLDALVAAVRYDPSAPAASPVAALSAGRGDSWDLALAYAALLRAAGIPALPVAGVVVDDSRVALRHYWVEFYLQGFGWVPVDPVLYSGASVGSFGPLFEEPSRYFGDMDERHVAFTRGLVSVAPNTPDGRTVSAPRRYSFQSVFEESTGAITSYTSFWSDVEITGVY